MGTVLNIISWIFSVLFLLLAFLVFGMGGRIQFFLVLGITVILFPPFRVFVSNTIGLSIPWWGYVLVSIFLWCGIVLSFVLNPAKSIYKSPEYRNKLIKIYEAKLAKWPVPYESVYIDTKYGKIHVIVSGPIDGEPIVLVNASALSGWSWIHNVKSLNEKYRTFAIDNIGEGGKNEMKAPGLIPKTGQEIADFYTEITTKLGITKAYVIGASIGGYISTNYAMYTPERVKKLVLLGSMGYGFTLKTVLTMTLAQGFPIKPVQDATFRWAFGDAPQVGECFGEWFRLYMKGLVPTPIAPSTFTPEQLSQVKVPTLAFFGTEDGVIGDAQKARLLAQNIPDIKIEIVASGHVIGAELPEEVNSKIIAFFQEDTSETKRLDDNIKFEE